MSSVDDFGESREREPVMALAGDGLRGSGESLVMSWTCISAVSGTGVCGAMNKPGFTIAESRADLTSARVALDYKSRTYIVLVPVPTRALGEIGPWSRSFFALPCGAHWRLLRN